MSMHPIITYNAGTNVTTNTPNNTTINTSINTSTNTSIYFVNPKNYSVNQLPTLYLHRNLH